MTLVMAILPIALLVAAMTLTWPRRWLPLPAHAALPGVAVLAYGLRFFQPDDPAPAILHAAVVDGVLSSLTPLAIVCLAIGFYPKPMLESIAPSVENTLAGYPELVGEYAANGTLLPVSASSGEEMALAGSSTDTAGGLTNTDAEGAAR